MDVNDILYTMMNKPPAEITQQIPLPKPDPRRQKKSPRYCRGSEFAAKLGCELRTSSREQTDYIMSAKSTG
jgi:hypothetical protein